MKIRITVRAERRMNVVDAHWRKHADYPNLFREELEAAWIELANNPNAGRPYRTVGRRKMRQLLLTKSRQWVIFSVNEKKGVITVHTIWGTARGREPKL